MSRWYQNVLTGQQVEVRTLAEDDYYVENASNWARIVAPSPVLEPEPEPEPELGPEPPPEPASRSRKK